MSEKWNQKPIQEKFFLSQRVKGSQNIFQGSKSPCLPEKFLDIFLSRCIFLKRFDTVEIFM
jgi:hypothetical protein